MKTLHGQPSERTRQTLQALSLFLIVMLGTALRLYGLDSKNLGGDEIMTATVSRQAVRSILQFHLEEAGNPPLLSLVTHFVFAWWGRSEFIARLPAALFGSLSVLLVYKVGRILWTREVGLIGAMLLAVSAYHVWFSQVARYYSLMLFLALLSLVFLLKALSTNRIGLWIAFALCTSLSLYNHYFAFLILPAEVVYGAWVIAENWLSSRGDRDHAEDAGRFDKVSVESKQAMLFAFSLALIGVSFAPWLGRLLERSSEQLRSGAAPASVSSLQLSLSYLHEVLTTYSSAYGAALLLWLGVFVVGLATCGRKRIVMTLLWTGIPFAFLAVVGPQHFLRPKYVLFTLPLYLLVVAKGIVFIAQLVDRPLSKVKGDRGWPVPVLTTFTVLIFCSFNLAPLRKYCLSQKEDWRSAVAYMRDNMAEGDVIIVDGQVHGGYGDTERPTEALTYYFSLHDEDITILPAKRGLADAIQDATDPGAGIWGVLWHHTRLGNLGRVGEEVEVMKFPRVAVVSVTDPHWDVLESTASVLETLLVVQPLPEGRFDLHLALAEIYLQTRDVEQAVSQYYMAIHVRPKGPQVARDLVETGSELEHAAYSLDEDIGYPLVRPLGQVINLLAYHMDATDVPAGGRFDVTIWWQALDKMDRDYTAFVHVVDANDQLWAQQDKLLQHGTYPTSTWAVGEILRDENQIQLSPDTPPGEYIVKAGIYYWETRERLPVWDENGQRVADDTVLLGHITVNGQ